MSTALDAALQWLFVEPCRLPLSELVDRLDTGDVLARDNAHDVALVVRLDDEPRLIVANGGLPLRLDEYLSARDEPVRVRMLLLADDDDDDGESTRRAALADELLRLLANRRRLSGAAPDALERVIAAAGGTWAALPRSSAYSESEAAAMRAASPAYALVDSYIRLGLVIETKSANLYDWHDVFECDGDVELALVDGVALTRPIYAYNDGEWRGRRADRL